MTTTISGTNGIDKIAAGAIEKADLPAGTVLQVVQGLYATATSTTSTSYVSTSLTASITPSSSSSKILVCCDVPVYQAGTAQSGYYTVYKNGSNLIPTQGAQIFGSASGLASNQSFSYLESPATTSSITYTIYMKTDSGGTAYICPSSTSGSITLMEIAA